MATPDERLADTVKRIDYWIRWHAKRLDLSLDAFAVNARVGRSSVARIRDRAPNLRTLSTIAAFLDVDVMDLLMPIPDEDGKGGGE